MQTASKIAFKEWAVVCAALATGRQTIILRKGGIDEGREGFRVRHNEFWLLPTRFHQSPGALKPGVMEDLSNGGSRTAGQASSGTQAEVPGDFLVDLYAIVQEVFEIRELAALQPLADEHILSDQTIEQRFHYRHPGLFVLVVRTYRLPQPYTVSDSPYIAGCKSWVELPEPLPTSGLLPVVGDADFDQRIKHIKSLIG